MPTILPKSIFQFLENLKENNNRDWMQENKQEYLFGESILKDFYSDIKNELNKTDTIEKLKVFRINRDIRFSNDKTPYNVHRSASFSRAEANKRGGYYLRLEPGNSFIAGGFFSPNAEDLLRIRKEFEMDGESINKIISVPEFKKTFGTFDKSNSVKTAPRGFDPTHNNIELIRLKSFHVRHNFKDAEVMSDNFVQLISSKYLLLRPFFDYMSEVLTTDLNGESIL